MNFSKILCKAELLKLRISKSPEIRKSDLPADFTVTYHAGAMYTKPNTLKSIREAVKDGASVIEFDVSFRTDGTPVIIHSSSPKENQGVLLYDALDAVTKSKSCKINLDLKSTANLPEIDRLVKEKSLFERVFYTGVFEDWVEKVKEASDIPYYLNYNIGSDEAASPQKAQAVADKTISLGAIGINSNFSNASKLFVEKMHKNGLLVSLWTIDKIPDMIKISGFAPDNITTKKPHIMNMMIK